MNKYSSKAVKTAATVGMSLAMVLSAAAPVMAAAPSKTVCTTGEDACLNVYRLIRDALDGEALADVAMDSSKTVEIDDTDYDVVRAAVFYQAGLKAYSAKTTDDTAYKNITAWDKITAPIVKMFGTTLTTGNDFMDGNEIATLGDTAATTDTDAAKGVLSYYDGQIKGDWLKDDKLNNDKKSEALDAWKQMQKWYNSDSYNVLSSDLQVIFDNIYDELETLVEDAVTPSDKVTATFVDEWSKVLEFDLSQDDGPFTKADSAVTGKASFNKISLSSKSNLKARIDAIKDAPDYEQVKDEEAVIAIIDSYQELIDNLADTKDLLKEDAYVDYTKTKTDDEDMTVEKFLKGKNFGDKGDAAYTTETLLKSAKDVAKHIDSEQLAILKALKEDVLDVAYNFETKKVGNYYLDKGEFNSVITSTQQNTIEKAVPSFFLKVVDTETGKFGIDYVIEYAEGAEKAFKAVTTDIEKLTPANIKTTDKATLEAAEDAYWELTNTKGKYINNLTSDQEKELRKVDAKITNLREAFDNLGVTNVAGWYDMGNGNWGYNNEDGTPAAYKWVASGADWYMIKDGKMLRNTWLATDGGRWYYLDNAGKMVTNQSVDGCWINSYGVYMSPSYNG